MSSLSWKKARLRGNWRELLTPKFSNLAQFVRQEHDGLVFRVLTDPLLVNCRSYRQYCGLDNPHRVDPSKVTVAVCLPVDNPGVTNLGRLNYWSYFYTNPRDGNSHVPTEFGARVPDPAGGRNFIHPDVHTGIDLGIGWLFREGIWAMTNDLPENNYSPHLSHIGRFFPLSTFSLSTWELISSRSTNISTTIEESHYAYRRTRTDDSASPASHTSSVSNPAPADRRG